MVEEQPIEPKPRAGGRGIGLKLFFSALITAAIVVFLLRYVRLVDIETLLAQANAWLLSLLPTMALMYWVRAWAFRLLSPDTPLVTMWSIMTVHNFLLRVLPMRTGELSYAFLVRRAGGAEIGRSLIGLLLVRLLDATVIIVIFAGALLFDRSLYRGDAAMGLMIAGGGVAAGAFLVLALRPLLALGAALLAFFARLLGLTRRPKIEAWLKRLGEGIDSYARYSLGFVFAQALLAAAVWLLNFVMVFQTLRGFGIQVSFSQAVLGSTAATISSLLPVGGIGSFGALEAGWVIGFTLVGLTRGVAVASAFGYSLYTFVLMGLFALVGMRLARVERR